jgi:acyl carrier protein phosphodiesterase
VAELDTPKEKQMNWLAHLYLSDTDTEHRLGNLLADFVKGSARQRLGPGLRRGLECHKVIDFFTDMHPVVFRSKQRIGEPFRRFAGVLVDVFYDHLLARNWDSFAAVPLNAFTAEIYASFLSYSGELPERARGLLERLAREDLLGSYRTLAGIDLALQRIALRLDRPGLLDHAVDELSGQMAELESDFLEFFPQLIDHVKQWRQELRERED